MAIAKRWAGGIRGTNIGNMFLTLDGDDVALTGLLRINEPGVGLVIYEVQGSFEASILTLTGVPTAELEGALLGDFTAVGNLDASGNVHGDWETTIGTAGTFVLYPHDGREQINEILRAEQSYTARHDFGAIEINREQIIEVSENIRRDFPNVIVSIEAGTQQSRYLDDFKQLQFSVDKADIAKIYADKPDAGGVNRMVTVEFGPNINYVMTQGSDEAWVLGQLKTLKRDLKRYERSYVTSYKRWGIGINQIILLAVIIYLPSLESVWDRMILVGIVMVQIAAVNALHSRYLPFADIQLRQKKTSWFKKVWPKAASWGMGIVSLVVATLAAAYLQGRLEIPTPPSVAETSATSLP